MTEENHACRWIERLIWSGWTRQGVLAERLARRVPVCAVCGRERPARRLRPAVLRETRAEIPAAPPLADAAGRGIAGVLVRRSEGREAIPAAGLLSDLAQDGIPASLAEEWIERFLHAGWLTATWRLGGSPRLTRVSLPQPAALRELAWPGEEDRRREALRKARERVAPLSHPKAAEIASLLASPEAGSFPPPLIQALAALAAHAESGEVLAERVFSARHLGGSKLLAALRGRLERLIGPLAGIGIREGAGVTLLGGDGALRRMDGEIDLRSFAPFLGLAREALENLQEIAFPAGGLFAVENLTVFEACCRGEVEAARGALIAWSAGYPGHAFRRLVELAGRAGTTLRIWTDLDLDGVRIARLIASWSSEAVFHRMSPQDLESAPRHHDLAARSLAAIRRDLEERPGAPLADTLKAMLDSGRWVEQEVFLSSGS
ncbi:MAG TPA: DUF2399 domain-containing protein [Thermoanaerobaculia bacterium]|jgi:hypothetical protein|nr:DUF2399 domain-containing protein [Thermoanaerobaculia bacterium]